MILQSPVEIFLLPVGVYLSPIGFGVPPVRFDVLPVGDGWVKLGIFFIHYVFFDKKSSLSMNKGLLF